VKSWRDFQFSPRRCFRCFEGVILKLKTKRVLITHTIQIIIYIMLRNKGFFTPAYEFGLIDNPENISEALQSEDIDVNAQDWIGTIAIYFPKFYSADFFLIV
jgi:hypothetical protein